MEAKTSSPFQGTHWWDILVILAVVAYLVINIFVIGGDNFVLVLNGNIGNPLALIVVILAIRLWRKIGAGNQDRWLWGLLAIGWALWTIAEFWWGIANLLGEEVPYPSVADVFWVIGYVPIAIALIGRIRRLPKIIKSWQWAAIVLCALLSLGWTVFSVLIPVIQTNDPSAIVQNILNLAYPLLDLFLLILVLRILFPYQFGVYGRAWFWISSGFVLHSLSGLLFVYATTAGTYYPDGQANLLSTLGVDLPYNLGYAVLMFGLALVLSIQKIYRPLQETQVVLNRVPNTHCLVFTRSDDSVIDLSHNFGKFFPLNQQHASTVDDLLGISEQNARELLHEIKTQKALPEYGLVVKTLSGQERVWVSGIAIGSFGEIYEGVIILLRLIRDDNSLDELLTRYEKDLLSSLVSRVGIHPEDEIKRLLANYYLAHIQPLYRRVYEEGGGIMVEAFFSEMSAAARKHDWQIGAKPDAILAVESLTLPQARTVLPIVFESAKQFVIRTIDEETFNQIFTDVNTHMDEAVLRDIKSYLTA